MTKNFCDICGKDMTIEGDNFYHCEPNNQLYAGNSPFYRDYDICMDCFHKMLNSSFIPHEEKGCKEI